MNASSSNTPSPRPAKKPITPDEIPQVDVPRGHLILTRRVGEAIRVGDVDFVVHSIRGGRVRVGVLSPYDNKISRLEYIAKVKSQGDANQA